MQIKSTVACALTLLAVASARPLNNLAESSQEANNAAVVVEAQSIEAQVQAELQQREQDEQLYGDFSGVSEKNFQSLAPNQVFDFDALMQADAEGSIDFEALAQEQETLLKQAETQNYCVRPFPVAESSYSDYSSSGSYCSSSSFGPSSSSYGCPMPAPRPVCNVMPQAPQMPIGLPNPCPAPCPQPRPCQIPQPCPMPVRQECHIPQPCPQPCPQPRQYEPCFASPFAQEFCDDSSSSSCSVSYASSSSSSSCIEPVFNINDYKFDVCGATAFGVVAQLRMIGLRFPNNPNAAQRTAFINYITGIINNFPCTLQRTIMTTYLAANPINVNDRKSFNKWAASFSKNLLTESKFPLGLNLDGMFVPVNRNNNAIKKRPVRK